MNQYNFNDCFIQLDKEVIIYKFLKVNINQKFNLLFDK